MQVLKVVCSEFIFPLHNATVNMLGHFKTPLTDNIMKSFSEHFDKLPACVEYSGTCLYAGYDAEADMSSQALYLLILNTCLDYLSDLSDSTQ